MSDPKADLHRYLKNVREAMIWKLDGLSEYDVRRPLTPTGTNLLGLVKHLTAVEVGYFGDTFERPFPEPVPWASMDAEPNSDMWATADETREYIVGLYRQACAHADATIEARELDSYAGVLAEVGATLEPHRLCGYLYDLARDFTTFYEACPVLKAEEPVRGNRLALCLLTARTLAHGLGLLGIAAPERM